MTASTDITLKNFIVYNASFGQKEGEEENKIMYFYPKDTHVDVQIKEVGLCEAIVKFSSTFTKNSCEALHTEKTRRLFFEPEENYWLILTIKVPFAKRGKDGLDGIEYLGGDVQDTVYLAVLKQAYRTARLFLGPFSEIIKKGGDKPDLLKKKLDGFFTKYIPSLRLKNCDILDIFQGVQFLPLDKITFLHCQSFVNLIEATIPNIEFSVFLYNEQLVWSGLPPEDIQVLFRYITCSLIPTYFESQHLGSLNQQNNLISGPGRFLCGLKDINDSSYSTRVPKVYLLNVASPGFYQLVVYRVLSSTMCWLIPGDTNLTQDWFRKLDNFTGSRLLKLSSEISCYSTSQGNPNSGTSSVTHNLSDQIHTSSSPSSVSRYLYFNSMNLATKSSLHDRKYSMAVNVNKDVLRALVNIHDLHERLSKEGTTSGEAIVKTSSEHWVVGLMSNCREFFVALDKKKTNLTEVSDEVKKVCDKQLKNIFFRA